MHRFHRMLAVLLVLCLSIGMFPVAKAAASAEILSLTVSADQTGATVRLADCPDAELFVALFSQNGQLISVGSTPVSGSSTVQELSVSLSGGTGTAHSAKAFLLDRTTHTPLCSPFTRSCTAEEAVFEIHDGFTEERTVNAVISTSRACRVVVEILDESTKEVLLTRSAEAAAGLQMETVGVYIPRVFQFPAHYLLRISLQDTDGLQLCQPYYSNRHTAAYAEFLSRTPEDFPDRLIIDFGTNGFGVLVDQARAIAGYAYTEDDLTYRFSSAEPVSAGDILLLTEEDGVQTPIKVLEVPEQDGETVTIVRDDQASMSDLYQFLRLDAFIDVGEADQNGGEADLFGDIYEDENELLAVNKAFRCGALSVNVAATLSLEVSACYDLKLFGPDYFRFKTGLHLAGDASATITGSFSDDDLDEPPVIELRSGFLTFVGSGLASVYLDVFLPLHFSFEGTGHAEIGLDTRSGFSYDTNNGFRPFRTHNSDSKFYIDGNFRLSTGIEIILQVSVVKNILSGTIDARAFIVADGTMFVREPEFEGNPESVHACSSCVDIDLNLMISARGSLDYRISDRLKGNLLSKDLLSATMPLCKLYYSILNAKDSVHEGEPTFGLDACPNILYRTTILTTDRFDNPVSDILIELVSPSHYWSFGSPVVCYLYNGAYTAWANFDGGRYQTQFEVEDGPMEITISEDDPVIAVMVTDAETGSRIDNATVTITREDGWTKTSQTIDGSRIFIAPPGKYTAIVKAEGYADKTFSSFSVINGEVTDLEAEMTPQEFIVQYHPNGGTSEYFILPDYVPAGGTIQSFPTGITRRGYIFEAWNTQADGYGMDVDSSTPILSDLVLYAVWRPRTDNEHRYHIASVTRPENVLTVMDCATQENYIMQMWDCGDLEDYTFHLVPESNGSYVIVSSFSGLAVTVHARRQWAADIRQNTYNNAPYQQWFFEPTGEDNTYYLRSAAGGYLTREDSVNSSRFTLEDTPGGENQKWILRLWD